MGRSLSEGARTRVDDIVRDLLRLFDREAIPAEEVDGFVETLDSKRVRRYVESLCYESKPEEALSDELLAGTTPLADYFFGEKYSEVSAGGGFVDFQVVEEIHPIKLELKPAFERVADSSGDFSELRRETLDWSEHREQIERYYSENEYLVLTDLRHWYFFSRYNSDPTTPIDTEPVDLETFYRDFGRIENLTEYLDRRRSRARTEELDDEFFDSLQEWIELYENVDFGGSTPESEKLNAIVKTINKFVFVQTLDSYAVVELRWIEDTWEMKEERWLHIGKKRVLEEFFGELTTWFQEYYDTELFEGTILDHIEPGDSNVATLYRATKRVLGVESRQQVVGMRGVTNYNFREIDEDVFGKAYETYLVAVRKDEGIYYTPRSVTRHIVSKTVGEAFDENVTEFHVALDERDFETARNAIEEMTEIRIVDPACGSGAFLIKALREVWGHYQEVITRLDEIEEAHRDWETLKPGDEEEEVLEAIDSLREILDYETERDLVSKIVLRHLHGVDLDGRALEVAKLNIWLEAIKLARGSFRYDNFSTGDRHVLPDLELNLQHGDSLMSLAEADVLETLQESYGAELEACSELRAEYLRDPKRDAPIDEVVSRIDAIREDLDEKFLAELSEGGRGPVLEEKPPLYWPLAFWYVYLAGAADDSRGGFDVVIGNPPYYTEPRGYKDDFRLYRQSPAISEYYQDKMDVFCFFVSRSIDLVPPGSRIGFIVPNYWNTRSSVTKMNRKIATRGTLTHVVDFDGYPVFDDPDIHSTILVFDVQGPGDGVRDGYDVPVVTVEDPDAPGREIAGALDGETAPGVSLTDRTVTYNPDTDRLNLGLESTDAIVSQIESKATVDVDEIPSSQGVVLPQDELSVAEESIAGLDTVSNGDGVFVLGDDELDRLGPNTAERTLVKPFYRPRFVDQFFVDTGESENLLYTEKSLIDYDGRDVFYEARRRVDEDGLDYSEIDEEVKEEYKREVREEYLDAVRSKYPNVTAHLDTFLEHGLITSDRTPYGIHRSRDVEFFEGEGRIVSVRKTPYPKFSPVEEPCYMDEGVVVIRTDHDPWLVASILNSHVLHFWYREGFGKTMGGLLQMDQEVVNAAPVRLPEEGEGEEIEALARAIHRLRGQTVELQSRWATVSRRLQSDSESLHQLLTNDKTHRQQGNTDLLWTESVSFFPDGDDPIQSEEFDSIAVGGDPTEGCLRVVGIRDADARTLFEMTFSDSSLMEHTYLALRRALSGGRQIDSLGDVFEKTDVPIVRPAPAANTGNLLEEAKTASPELDYDTVIEVDAAIDDNHDELNARVFDLYDLTYAQAREILESLGVRTPRKNTLLDRLEGAEGE